MNVLAPRPVSGTIGGALLQRISGASTGDEIYATAAAIFPICRSITGDGVRETLSHLARHVGLEMREVASGTPIFDWTVPREWNIREAWIKGPSGETIVDLRDSSLHVLSYSRPVRATLPLSELRENIFTLPERPEVIPYRTAYAGDRWGFCMSHRQLEALPQGDYEVLIDSTLEDGSLTYGEFIHKGETDEEVLLSAHICHPSLANDNCSGLALLTHLAKSLSTVRTRYTYRFLFAPGTLGAITWLATHRDTIGRIKHGVVLSCVGDPGGPTYKKSRRGNALVDRAFVHVLSHAAAKPNIVDFFPYGYDERQYGSPGFDLPVGLFQRSQFGTFPEYHTSADNLDFITPASLEESYRMVLAAIEILETDHRYVNTNPYCEPQLGRRGLYTPIGGAQNVEQKNLALLWVLNLSDGEHSLLEIAERAKMPFTLIAEAAERLLAAGLLADGEVLATGL
jgi:aminopeptidase-like protein